MPRKASLLNPGLVGPSAGPFGPLGGLKMRRGKGGRFAKGGRVPRFDFGGLFGGQPGTTTQQSNSAVQSTGATNNMIADPQYNQLRDQTLGTAAGLDFSDPSKYIAGLNNDQYKAFEGVRANQGVYQGNYNAAQADFNTAQGTAANIAPSALPYVQQAGRMQTGTQAFNPFAQQAAQGSNTTVGNYMDPYQQNAMDAVGAASNKAFGAPGGPMERINDTFTGGNAAQFGRERHGDAMGNAVYNQQQALDQQLAQMANTGWQSGLTAATADQNRIANLAGTAGQIANQDITTRAGLGKTTADIGTAATGANIAAGQAQQGLGTARQSAGYTDANALLSVGNQQQQLEQQQKSMPLQGLQYQQSLGQGWQLPTSSNFLNTNNSGGSSTTTQSQPQGSIAGQVVGAGAAIAGALGGDNNKNPDGTTKSARGGQINPFGYATGGYVPTVTGVRKRNAMRAPPPPSPMGPMGGMGGMQPTGMPGMPPPGPPAAAALNPMPQPPPPMPHPANRRFAQGGPVPGFDEGGLFGPAPVIHYDDPKLDAMRREMERNPWGSQDPMTALRKAPITGGLWNALDGWLRQRRDPATQYARGGVFAGGGPFNGDAAQDRAMVTRGIHQHERDMHKATSGQLTKLRLARGGGVPGYDTGGAAKIPGADPAVLVDANSPFGDSTVFPKLDKRLGAVEDSVARFPSMPVAVAATSPFFGGSANAATGSESGSGPGAGGPGGGVSESGGSSGVGGNAGVAGEGADSGTGGTYAGGGGVPGYRYGGLEIRGNPTPSIRGNLPPPTDQGDDTGGREVPPVNPLEWFQRANPWSFGGGSFVPKQWASLPEPDPRDIDKLNRLHQQNPEWYPQYDTPNMPRGETPLPPAAVRAVVNRSAAPSRRAAPSPAEDEPRSGWRAWGYDPAPAPAPERNFFDKLFSWFGGKGYHAEGGQANPLGTDSKAGFGPLYKEPLPAGKYGYAGGGSFGSGMPLVSIGTDAVGVGMEAANGDQGMTPEPSYPYDPASGIWDTLAGGNKEPEDEETRLARKTGRVVGDAVSTIFPIAQPLFAEGFDRFFAGGDKMIRGDFGGALNKWAAGTPAALLFHSAEGGRVPGYAEGTSAQRPAVVPGDRAALDEAPSTGPFGTGIRLGPIAATKIDFGHPGPMYQPPLLGGGSGSGGGAGSSGGDIASMGGSIAKMIPMLKGLFGGSDGVTATGSQGTGPGGIYTTADTGPGGILGSLGGGIGGGMPDIDTEIADWSSYGGFARGGRIPHFAEGDQFGALDEDSSSGPFGESIKPTIVGQTVANYTPFGPLGELPSAGGGAAAAGGGGGGGGNKAGKAMSGALSGAMAGMSLGPVGAIGGGLLGGLSGLFGAQGGQVPYYAEGGKFDYGETPGRAMTNRQKLAYWSAMNMYRGGPFNGRR